MIDIVKLLFKAGNGGDGRVSFLRQKFRPKGGPDGGDGGDGGSIYLVGTKNLNTLYSFVGKKSFSAQNGEMGGKTSKSGKKGEDLIVLVPVGTIVWKLEEAQNSTSFLAQLDERMTDDEFDDERDLSMSQRELNQLKLDDVPKTKLFEILEDGQKVLLAKGGNGGYGNEHYKSASNTTPQEAQKGEAGAELSVLLELKLLADVGLVGFPNAGKSTFLKLVTKANPKIANYPFTTLEPNLGVMLLSDGSEVVVADIPGLIEGANVGKGLGIAFLRHVERCKVLVFVLFLEEAQVYDETLSEDQKVALLQKQFDTLESELSGYSERLKQLPRIITVNKMDLYDEKLRAAIMRQLCKNNVGSGTHTPSVLLWSAATKEGVEELKERVRGLVR